MSEFSLSWVPAISRKVVIAGFLVEGWIFTALIAATVLGIVGYGEVRYLHWTISLTIPVWVLLMSNTKPRELSPEDEKRAIMAMAITFIIFVIVALAWLLKDSV
ncbi:hypothetical protein [Methanolobus sp. WCC4]|uniref:hypothetical protein n=1 Tax=Methanolobus sp. WCC4 TaxID=3125784 RepID=UPI0030FB7A49